MNYDRIVAFDSIENSSVLYGAPITFESGKLFFDMSTSKYLLQVKYDNITEKEISEIKFDVFYRGPDGIVRKDFFVLREPLPGKGSVNNKNFFILTGIPTLRSLMVIPMGVIFVDGTYWQNNGAELVHLQAPLINNLKEHESDYRRELSQLSGYTPTGSFNFLPAENSWYWRCSCGRINGDFTEKCYNCGINRKDIFSIYFKYVERVKKSIAERRKKAKRISLIVAGIVLALILASVAIFVAYSQKNNYKDFEISVYDDYVEIVRYKGKAKTVTVPSEIRGEKVTSIGKGAFQDCTTLENITIPDSVTSIGDGAFSGCTNLESITIPFVGATLNGTSNRHFGYIFGATESLDNNSYVPLSLKTVVITGGNTIGESAFYGCSRLENITIGSGVTSIGPNALSKCTSLKSITIPFVGASLDGTSNAHFAYLFGFSEYYLVSNRIPLSLKTVIITGGDSIPAYAFYGCSSLTTIIISESVTSIGPYAFYGCRYLESITIPENVTSIGDHAFSYCYSIKTVYVNRSSEVGVIEMGVNVFNYCTRLNNIYVLDSKSVIDYKEANGWSRYKSIIFIKP